MPKQSQPHKAQSQVPIILILVFCAVLAFILTQIRDGWAQDIAWLAVSISLGALVMLFFDSRR